VCSHPCQNLISNAVKFTPEGGRVDVGLVVDDGGAIVIFVTDSGIGMTEQGIEIALRPFGQIDDGHTRKYEGTGLGLPITKKLTEAHDGTLRIASAPGEGTAMLITFPPKRAMTVTVLRDGNARVGQSEWHGPHRRGAQPAPAELRDVAAAE
jgi:two-component system cell cycle sensor histidine kinase PleC